MKFTKQISNIGIGILFLITCVFVFRNPIVYFPDSTGYLDMYIIRSAGYTIFLKINQLLFGSYFEVGLIATQLLIGLSAIYFFVQTIRKYFSLGFVLTMLLTLALLIPYYFNGRIANNILSEALSYGLYLVVMARFIAFFIAYQKKQLLLAIPFLFILLLTRTQFYYLIPIAILMLVWVIVKEKQWKNYRIILGIFLLLPLLTTITDKTFHKIVHHHFVSTPWTGIHLAAPAYFVADAADEVLFTNPEEKALFKKIIQQLNDKNLNVHHLQLSEGSSKTMVFVSNYTSIANKTIYRVSDAHFDSNLTEDERFILVDAINKKMTVPLIKDNFRKWLGLYYGNIVFGFGSLKYALLYMCMLIFSLRMLLKRNDVLSRIISLLLLCAILNVCAISIGIHAVFRYTFYNDWVVFLVVFLLFAYWKKSKNSEDFVKK